MGFRNETDSMGNQSEAYEYNQCQEAVRRLNDYLSQELLPDEAEEVNRHLSQCRGCFAKFRFEETLLRTIKERIEQVHAPLALRERVLGLLHRGDAPEKITAGTRS